MIEIVTKVFNAVRGFKTYIASGATVVFAVAYAVFTFDLVGAGAMIGISAQAAALRDALANFKKAVDEKITGLVGEGAPPPSA